MNVGDFFKLEKLKIIAIDDKHIPVKNGTTFEVMFNPETLSKHIRNKLKVTPAVNSDTPEVRPAGSEPEKLELHLVIDGTGAADYGLPTGLGSNIQTVARQITNFKALCYNINAEKHEPDVVRVEWGEVVNDNYRLESADITYKSFDRNANPLRAELDVVFIKYHPKEEDKTPNILGQSETSSPDLTHIRITKAGDTLPLLSREIYGSSKHYLFIATANNLNHFRRLEPGQQLVFPPLEQ